MSLVDNSEHSGSTFQVSSTQAGHKSCPFGIYRRVFLTTFRMLQGLGQPGALTVSKLLMGAHSAA
ncbi:hypothetical protein CTA1_1862 [Colletotrichum tanaceti]|uniref:Uncharacterized protein n=1 Tax=Colletotrichum tanaceti TaxID=1306861 RepID=A0A4U6X8E0_9PEZI|nr:hypothetical protein CTA1_1862 [Colletotrichum tanaceti]